MALDVSGRWRLIIRRFGHIYRGAGHFSDDATQFVNAAHLNESYKPLGQGKCTSSTYDACPSDAIRAHHVGTLIAPSFAAIDSSKLVERGFYRRKTENKKPVDSDLLDVIVRQSTIHKLFSPSKRQPSSDFSITSAKPYGRAVINPESRWNTTRRMVCAFCRLVFAHG